MNRRAIVWIDLALRAAKSWVEVDESIFTHGRAGLMRIFSNGVTKCWRDFHAAMEMQRSERTWKAVRP
jgi:hypothetical protein